MISRSAGLALLLLALTGCAKNQLLREDTAAFVKAADESVKSGAKFYHDLVKSDRETRTLLYMLDVDCRPPEVGMPDVYFVIEEQDSVYSYCSQRAPDPAASPLAGGFTPESFADEFQALAFISAYIKGLTKLATAEELHAAANFSEAIAHLEIVRNTVNPGTPPLLNDKRVTAASGLIGFIQTLSSEKIAADKIREAVRKDGAKAAEHLKNLIEALALDQQFVPALDGVRENIARTALRFDRIEQSSTRRAVIEELFAAQDRRIAAAIEDQRIDECKKQKEASADSAIKAMAKYCASPAAGLMAAAEIAHVELTSLIAGKMNERQRARLARLGLRRFLEALKLIVSLRSEF